MNVYHFRMVVSKWLYRNIGIGGQGNFARSLGVRDATVSSWMNKNSSMSIHYFFMAVEIFAVQGKCQASTVLLDFYYLYRDMKKIFDVVEVSK